MTAQRPFLSRWSDFCAVAPSPQLRERQRAAVADARRAAGLPVAPAGRPRRFGLDDGVILPPHRFPVGTPADHVRRAAARRAPLRGALRVVVVLAQFSDRPLDTPADHYEDLFFSTGSLPTGSVTEYYQEVSGGLVSITGQVVGPYTMPQPLSWYANGNFGIGEPSGEPRAQFLARDAAAAADADVDLAPYDNDGNGYVDAFIVVHAGRGGEETGDSGDIWSHKWVLPEELDADGTRIYAYLTIPEDAKLGVSAHELGHLVFGFPDLYDTDYTSEGIGDWCLMAGGSWNGGGDTPAHPSAWCKANQEWVTVTSVSHSATLQVDDVKDGRTVYRLWSDGAAGPEYFLVENRQRRGFDAELPGDGLLVWHVDEAQGDNTDESHYLVGLLQADGARDLELGRNRGDGGDPYPGSQDNRVLDGTTTPATTTYAGQDSSVSLRDVSDPGPTMTVAVSVSTAPTDGGGAGGEGGEDTAARVAKLEAQLTRLETHVTRLEHAVTAAAGDLITAGADGDGAVSGASTWSPR